MTAESCELSQECNYRAAAAVAHDRLPPVGLGEDTIYADKQLVIAYEFMPSGLRFSGEIDAWNLDGVVETITRRIPDSDLHFELSKLSFADISGIRALASVAWNLKPGYRLFFHGL